MGQVFTCGQPGHRKGGSNVDTFHSVHISMRNLHVFALLQDGRSGSPAAHFQLYQSLSIHFPFPWQYTQSAAQTELRCKMRSLSPLLKSPPVFLRNSFEAPSLISGWGWGKQREKEREGNDLSQEHSTSGPQTYSPITLAHSPSQFSPHTDREDRFSKVASACSRAFSITEAGVRSSCQILCWTLADPDTFFRI